MMKAQEREMLRGDSLVLDVDVTTSTGGAYNLAGAKLWMTAKHNVAVQDSAAVFQLTSDPANGITIVNAAAGKARIVVPASATRLLPDGETRLVYDIQVLDAAGIVTTIEFGTLLVSADVTRAIE